MAKAPETKTVAAGHNGVSETAFFKFKRKLDDLNKDKDGIMGRIKAHRKEGKSMGINMKQFDAVTKLAKLASNEVAEEFNDGLKYAKFLKLPVYEGLEFYKEAETTEEERAAQAYDKGRVARKGGSERDRNPWPDTTPMGNQWLNGWDAEDRELAGGVKADAAPVTGEKAKVPTGGDAEDRPI